MCNFAVRNFVIAFLIKKKAWARSFELFIIRRQLKTLYKTNRRRRISSVRLYYVILYIKHGRSTTVLVVVLQYLKKVREEGEESSSGPHN